jgi:hypothetical protein
MGQRKIPLSSEAQVTPQHLHMQVFNTSPIAVGLAAVKLALLQQESQEIQKGMTCTHEDTISQSVLITMGLDLEELQ